MKTCLAYLAFDLGAESGRAVLGRLRNDRIELQEIYRFSNGPVRVGDSLYWDVLRLWNEMTRGLSLAVREVGHSLVSLGVDTWGVDFGLLDIHDRLIGNPFHYRDRRTEGMPDSVSKQIPLAKVYQQTGIQPMAINSLYQLLAMAIEDSPQLAAARTFLNMPDLLNFWFSGVKASEYTIATTTQCYCPSNQNWAWDLLRSTEIPPYIFGHIVPPGAELGKIRPGIAEESGSASLNIIAVASHDTQAAIAAIPVETEDYIYLSSGTWSLMGIEVEKPLITEKSRALGFSNEGGYGGKFCLLKNITGLWLLQECRREWASAGWDYTYEDLTHMAASAASFRSFIVPTDAVFLSPGKMTNRIQTYCRSTDQPIPEQPAEFVRCILESLALEYRHCTEQICELTGRTLPVIHVIGGGAKNELLNQFTANASGRRVISGPAEATALGNILVQSITSGELRSLAEARSLSSHSTETHEFTPCDTTLWDQAYERSLHWRN